MTQGQPEPWKALSTAFKDTAKGPTWYDFDQRRVVLLRAAPLRAWHISRAPGGTLRGVLSPDVDVAALIRDIDAAARVGRGDLPEGAVMHSAYRVRRRATFGRFLEHIDRDVQRLAADGFAGNTWPYLRVLQGSVVAREIAGSQNGAPFVFSLSIGHELLERPLRGYWHRVERWLRLPRKDALAALGFPCAPSSAALLSKIPRASLCAVALHHLRAVLHDPERAKRCFHAERLSLPLLCVLARNLLPYTTPVLLFELEQATTDVRHARHVADDLADTVELAAQHGVRLGRVASVADVAAVHDAWVTYARTHARLPRGALPALPIALSARERQSLVPLLTFEALRAEGAAMKHCLGTLPHQVEAAAAGRFYAFAVDAGARATLAVWRPTAYAPWQRYDVRGPMNAPAPESLYRLADALVSRFERARLSIQGTQLAMF